VRFPAARSADQDEIGAVVDPAVASADRHHMGLGDHRHCVEVEAVEGLARQQPRFGEVALDAPAVAFGDLVFGERGEEAGSWPGFLVGPLGEDRPALLDRGQPQLVEDQGEPGGVDALVADAPGHAASPMLLPRSAS
jgi:hypothetical protein